MNLGVPYLILFFEGKRVKIMRKFTVFKGLALTLLMVLSFLQVASAIGDSSASDEFIPKNRNNPVTQNKLSSVDQNKIAASDIEDPRRVINPQMPYSSDFPLSQGADDQLAFSRDNKGIFRPLKSPFPFLENSQNAQVPLPGGSNEEYQEAKSLPVSGTEVAFDFLPENNTWKDFAVDDDGNGLYDRLVIDIGHVNQTTNQDVILFGILKGEAGQWLGISQNSTDSTAGNNISLSFAAQPINASGIAGNYTVWIHLFSIDAYLPDFNFSLAYTTSEYNPVSFESPSAEMVGFSDYALDTDGDLLLDEIIINVSLLVKETGQYTVGALLGSSDPFSPEAQLFMQTESKYLTPGNRSIEIHFRGFAFFSAQMNGPYSVGFAYVSTEDDLGSFPNFLQILTDPYNTSSYSYSDFDPPPAFLTGRYWEQGIDTNANGRYDQFEITIEINTTQAGHYSITLALRPSNQNEPVLWGSTYGSSYWSSGVQNVSVLIDTTILYSQRLNTPYIIDQITINDYNYGILDQAFSAHTTQVYDYNEFDIPGAILTGRYSDRGADTDSDGKFDQVIIDVEVNVTQPGYYSINLYLRAVASELSDPSGFWGSTGDSWGTGVQNISVAIETPYFYSWRLNSPLRISTVTVHNSDYKTIDQASSPYTTRVYNYHEFDIPEAFLTGIYGDRGADTNSDGKFDLLLIDVEINVTQAGAFELFISLRSSVSSVIFGSYSLWGSIGGALSSGVQNISIPLETQSIYSWRLNTSFIIQHIEIYAEYSVDQAYNAYTTQIYHYTEFDRPAVVLTGDYWDEGVDTDASGKFDQLMISVGVDVTEADYYYLNLNLVFDDFTNLWGDTNQYLDVGIQNITVRVRNWALAYLEHFDTAFIIEQVEIYDPYYNRLDQAYLPYTTQVYHYTEFDPPGAFLTGNYWDYGTDTDANNKFDLLVIDVEVNVTEAGYYSLDVSLESSRPGYYNYSFGFWGSAGGYWGTGVQNVSVLFEAASIYYHHVNTSFQITYGYLLDSNWETLGEFSFSYITRTYNFDEFDIPGAQLTGVYGDQGVDGDSDGKFDELRIDVEVDVTEAGYYELAISLISVNDMPEYFWGSVYGFWGEGLSTISVFFDSILIYGTHLNSAYMLESVSIHEGESYQQIDGASDAYITRVYRYDEFSPPGVTIVGIYADQGVDFDNDGNYDYLAVAVGIEVVKPEICMVRVEGLSDQTGTFMWVYGETLPVYYPVGTFNVTVYVKGPDISYLASSSPWTAVSIVLANENGNQLDQMTIDYQTQTYKSSDFEETMDMDNYYDMPPSIGGLFIEMGPVEKDFAIGDSIQLRVGAADDTYIREVRLSINGVEDSMQSSEGCQDCGFWSTNYSYSYVFNSPGTYEFYAVAVDTRNQISGNSNIIKIVILSESKSKRSDSPGFTSDMLIIAGLVILLAWGSGWRKRKKDC